MKAAETIQYNNTVNKKKFKQSWMREKNEVQKNIIIYGQFLREMPETTDEKESWNWLRKVNKNVNTNL